MDAATRPLRLIVTEGQTHDISCAKELVEHLRAKVVIPPRSNRKSNRHYSRTSYRTRNVVERFLKRIKNFR